MAESKKSSETGVKSIFKKSQCTADVKNPCKLCLQPVTLKNGIMCKGECRSWAHFKCLNYTPGKIKDIKKGVITVACPCPDCSLDPAKKEYLTKPPYRCNNDMCPANRPQVCGIKGCPNHNPKIVIDASPVLATQNEVMSSDPESNTSNTSYSSSPDSSDTDTSVRFQVNQVQDQVADVIQQQYQPAVVPAQPQVKPKPARAYPQSLGRPSNVPKHMCNPEDGCNPPFPKGGNMLDKPEAPRSQEYAINKPDLRTDFRNQEFRTQDYNDYRNPGFIENRTDYGFNNRNERPPMMNQYDYNVPPDYNGPQMVLSNSPMPSYSPPGQNISIPPMTNLPDSVRMQNMPQNAPQLKPRVRKIGSPACVCGRNVYYYEIANSRSDTILNKDYNLRMTLENMQNQLGVLNSRVQRLMRR